MSSKNSQLQVGMMGDSQSEEDPSEEWIQRHEHSQQLIKNLKSIFQNDDVKMKHLATNQNSEIKTTKHENNHMANKRAVKDNVEGVNGAPNKWNKPSVPPNKPPSNTSSMNDHNSQLKRDSKDNVYNTRGIYKPLINDAAKLSAQNHNKINVANSLTKNKLCDIIVKKDNTSIFDHNGLKDEEDEDEDDDVKLPSISELARVFEGDRYKNPTNKNKFNNNNNNNHNHQNNNNHNRNLNTHNKSELKMANMGSSVDEVFASNEGSNHTSIPLRGATTSLKITTKKFTKVSSSFNQRNSINSTPEDPMKLKLDFTSVLKSLKHVAVKTEKVEKRNSLQSDFKMDLEEDISPKDSFKIPSPNAHSTLYKSKIDFKKADMFHKKPSDDDKDVEKNNEEPISVIGKQKDKSFNWSISKPNAKMFLNSIHDNSVNKNNAKNDENTYKSFSFLNKNKEKNIKNMGNKKFNNSDYKNSPRKPQDMDVQSAEFLNFCLKPTNLLSKLIQNDQYNYQAPNTITNDNSIDDSSISFQHNIFNGAMLEKKKTLHDKNTSKTFISNTKISVNDEKAITDDDTNEKSKTHRNSVILTKEHIEESKDGNHRNSSETSQKENDIDEEIYMNSDEVMISTKDPTIETNNNADNYSAIKRTSKNSKKGKKTPKIPLPQATIEPNNSNNPYKFYNGSTSPYYDYNNNKDPSLNEEKEEVIEEDKKPKWRKIIDELLKTEEGYVKKLAMLNNDLKGRVTASNLLTEAEIERMFMNLTDIFIFHQQQLLPAISASVHETNGGIGEVFSKLGPKLRMYAAYHSGFSQAVGLMNQKNSKNQAFQGLLLLIQSSENFNNLTAQHHMLAVIQRVPQYILILQRYLKEVDQKSPEYSSTLNALNCLKNVAELNNTSTTHQSKGLSATFSPSSSAASPHLVCSSCAKKIPSKHVLCHACQKFYCKSCFHWRPINKKLKKFDDDKKQQKTKVKFCSDCLVEQEEAAERLKDDTLKVIEGKLRVKHSKNEWIEHTFLIDSVGTFYMLENDGIPRLEKIPLDNAELILANQSSNTKNNDLYTFTLKWKSKTTKHFKAANQKEFDEWLASLYSLMDRENRRAYSFKSTNGSYDVSRSLSVNSVGSPDESET